MKELKNILEGISKEIEKRPFPSLPYQEIFKWKEDKKVSTKSYRCFMSKPLKSSLRILNKYEDYFDKNTFEIRYVKENTFKVKLTLKETFPETGIIDRIELTKDFIEWNT